MFRSLVLMVSLKITSVTEWADKLTKSEQQKALAHLAVDSGADLVLGHHPHVLQGIEEYRGRLILYSLGNFVFDRQIQPGTDETFILELTISGGKWKEAALTPIKIVNCQPRPAEEKKGEEILLRLQKYSQGLNTSLVIREGRGYLENKKPEDKMRSLVK
jgi:poly-gamma-glutamate synthesis protein (capsule biosynthesis protein)